MIFGQIFSRSSWSLEPAEVPANEYAKRANSNANGKATITLTSHIEGNGHNIEGFGMSFRYIAGYGCAGTAKPCPGAPIVTVVLVDATTMSDLATVWTSPPLGNYSYGQFDGYSPPVVVDVHGLNVSNANPVLIQLRIANNKRNLQMQLAPKTGLNATISWTKQTFSQNASGCDASCVEATLTTNKCGVASPWIQLATVLGGAAVGSDNGLSLGSPRPGFLFTDGFQTAFTDTPSTGALWARGGGLVPSKALRRLLTGCHPKTGAPLGSPPRTAHLSRR